MSVRGQSPEVGAAGARDVIPDCCGRCVGSSALRQRRRSLTVLDDVSRHGVVLALNVSSSVSDCDGKLCSRLIKGTVSKVMVLCSLAAAATCLTLMWSRRSLTLVARRFIGVDITPATTLTYFDKKFAHSIEEIAFIVVSATT